MKFTDLISTLPELQDFSVEIKLNSGESIIIENILGKQASFRLLQHHLGGKDNTIKKFAIEGFCEYHDEWSQEPDGHHTTIDFLNRYNREGGEITKK